jgi:hypothetical protein
MLMPLHPFNADQDLQTERIGPICRRITCILCKEVIYDAAPEASKAAKDAEWKKTLLHLALMHDYHIVRLVIPVFKPKV